MARNLSKKTLEEIRFRCDIADVLGSYLQLKRAGSGFKALCPFHKEKTPSFNISPQRQTWHCFGCGAGGDVFTFVMQHEGVDFFSAAQMLAERAGVTLDVSELPGEDGMDKSILYRINAEAASFYHRHLLESGAAEGARDYLKRRGLSDATIEEFGIGYAPNLWDAVLKGAQQKKYTLEQIEGAGLIVKSQKETQTRYYDRFRDRVMFPIRDEQGRVIGFSGRTMNPTEKAAKYVNTPETPLFKKSRVLYALDKARRHIVESREAIICEGQVDVIQCHQAGFKTAIASQGTAFTEDHARILQRYADSVCLSFDPDKAGQDASIRAVAIFLQGGLAVRVAAVPAGEDADSLIRKNGPDAFRKVLDRSMSAVAFQVQVLSTRENRQSEVGTMRIAKAVLNTIRNSPNAVQRVRMVQEAAQILSLPATALQDDLRHVMARQRRSAGDAPAPVGSEVGPGDHLPDGSGADSPPEEIALCEHMVRADDVPELVPLISRYLRVEMIRNPACRRIVGAVLDAARRGCTVQDALKELDDPTGAVQRFVAQIVMTPTKLVGNEVTHADAVKDLILRLWRQRLKQERGQLGDDQAERRAQITYDLKALNSWEAGSRIVEIELAHGPASKSSPA